MLENAIKMLKDGKFEPALVLFNQIMKEDPANAAAYGNAALCHACQGRFDKAIELTKLGLEKHPDNYLFLANLATFYSQIGELEQSLSYIRACQAIKESPEGWARMGLIYWDMREYTEAEKCFKKALEFDPSNVNMHVNLALLHLMHGRFEEGFKEYLWRVDPNSPMEHYLRCYDQRRQWGGISDLTGKRFLVYGEQGLGDIIQFARYLPELKTRGATVIYHCPETLAGLMGQLADEVFTKDIELCKATDLPEYDFQCTSMSLPYYLRSFQPTGDPYIVLPKTNDFCTYYGCNVGVAWGGSADHPNDSQRSIPIEEFKKLFCDLAETKLSFYGFQVGSSVELNDSLVAESAKIYHDSSQHIKTFYDTARGLQEGIHLVITCDSALAHLAGALGYPCWVLAPYSSDWRWGLGDTTPWYKSVRIFRQPKPGDWASVIETVKKELIEFEKGY